MGGTYPSLVGLSARNTPMAMVLWVAQAPYWNAPFTWLTLLTAAGVPPCIAYIVILKRKGL